MAKGSGWCLQRVCGFVLPAFEFYSSRSGPSVYGPRWTYHRLLQEVTPGLAHTQSQVVRAGPSDVEFGDDMCRRHHGRLGRSDDECFTCLHCGRSAFDVREASFVMVQDTSLMRRSYSAAVTTWFRVPEQGMAKYEMLCRGTAFCTSLGGKRDSLYVFTCAHIIAPWRWPRLYPLPWLQYVKQEHTLCLLHTNEASGGPIPGRIVLDQHRAIHHEQLDVCILPFMSESPASGRLRHTEVGLEPLQLRGSPPPVGEPVLCPAYVVERGRASLDSVEGGKDVHLDDDVVLDDYKSRGFATMDQELTDGACGAPLVGDKGECVGLVEGVVPMQRSPNDRPELVSDEDFNSIKGSAGFIYPSELLRLAERARKELE